MVNLSVNVNKVATLRNSRGGRVPSVVSAVEVCLAEGVQGITVHPRADARHITATDVREVAVRLRAADAAGVEYNIEGDPRPDWLALVHELVPTQATLVPVRAGEVTSEAGWRPDTDIAAMREVVDGLRGAGIRVCMFVDADRAAIDWVAGIGADRVELYTEPYAVAFAASPGSPAAALRPYVEAATHAHACGLGVNAGHDLDLYNLAAFATLPHLDEVSIGHALMSDALFVGLSRAVRDYLSVLSPPSTPRR